MEEGELDLTPYLDMLIRRCWMIDVTILDCIAVAAAVLWLQPTTYQADVVVATVKASTQVSLGSSIRTLSESDLGAADIRQRLAAFEQLVKSPAVAEEVLNAIGNQLPENLRRVDKLLKIIKGGIIESSDALYISATHADPQVAVSVANAWGQAYVRQVNLIYAGTVGESHVAIQREIETARAEYDQAQAALETLLREDRYDELTRRIGEYETMLQGMANVRGQEMATLLGELQRIDRLLANAEVMYAQVRQGGDAAAKSNALALPLLKAQAFASNTTGATSRSFIAQDQPAWETTHPFSEDIDKASSPEIVVQSGSNQPIVQIQAIAVDMKATEMVNDLEALIAALQDRRADLEQELTALAEAAATNQDWTLSKPLAPNIAQIEQQVRSLRAELAREQSRLSSTQAQRELAWQSYDSLVRKEAEMAIAAQTTAAQVRLAAPARVPKRASFSIPRTLVTALAVGLVLGIMLVSLLEFLQGYRARAGASLHGQA